jgi:4-hydroxyphenylpyruvate dioxygenase
MDKEVKSVEYGLEKYLRERKIFFLLGTDYVEFYVGNAKQSAIIIKQLLGTSH